MNYFLLSVAFAFMAGTLFYSEQTDRSFNAQTVSTGWFAAGLMVRITVMIVMVVLIAVSISAVLPS